MSKPAESEPATTVDPGKANRFRRAGRQVDEVWDRAWAEELTRGDDKEREGDKEFDDVFPGWNKKKDHLPDWEEGQTGVADRRR